MAETYQWTGSKLKIQYFGIDFIRFVCLFKHWSYLSNKQTKAHSSELNNFYASKSNLCTCLWSATTFKLKQYFGTLFSAVINTWSADLNELTATNKCVGVPTETEWFCFKLEFMYSQWIANIMNDYTAHYTSSLNIDALLSALEG